MSAVKSSIKRALYALGISQRSITHLSFSYARGKRNVRIGLFVVQRAFRQILIGGGQLNKDSACGLESWISSACSDKSPILRRGLAHYRLDKSLRPRLESGDFSSTILESTISLESKAQNKQPAKTNQITPESKNLDSGFSPSLRGGGKATNEAIHKKIESTFAKLESMDCHATATALARNDRKIDSSQSSSRADKVGVAIQSNQSRTLSKVRNLESVQGVWGFKGDKGERFASSPPVPLEKNSSQAELESSDNAQKVDSSMDCHATATALARNDNENAQSLNTPQAQARLDSSKSQSDSKILDEKCGLQGKSQGSYLSGNDRRDFSPLPHFSLKAESPQAKNQPPQTPPVLISLTSFPARLPYLHHTLYSLLTQDYKDFHIALFLSSSEVDPSKLPLILRIFARLGLLSIHFVEENLRAYKKLFYALQAYPDHIVITIDDDMIYAPNTIRLLLESYERFPRAIHTHLAYDGEYIADIIGLDPHKYCAIIKESSPHLALASVGVSGVLYPPSPFTQEFFNTQAIVALAPWNDDLWFFVMSVLNDMPKVLVKGALEHPKQSSIAQDESPNLWEINCEQHRNYDQLRALLEAYPQARAKILDSLESKKLESSKEL